MSEYESRLDRELLSTLLGQRVAALGTLQADGKPYVSMVPYAIESGTGRVVLQVANLAPHAQHMRDDPRVSMLVIAIEVTDLPASSLPRLTLEGRAEFLVSGSADWQTCRAAFIGRYPDSGPLNAMLEFDFVALRLSAARQVSGFGAARSVAGESLQPLLAAA
jgi:putative heme iron utilization protein